MIVSANCSSINIFQNIPTVYEQFELHFAGLALDWCGQNLYWIDSSVRIEIAKLDGSYRRTLIWQGLKKAKSIALDPLKG